MPNTATKHFTLDTATFQELGYDIVSLEDPYLLLALRKEIYREAQRLVGSHDLDENHFLNNFHHHKLTGTKLNEVRLAIYLYCREHLDLEKTILNMFRDPITKLVGADILVQKGANLVIQQPNDPDVAPTHRDAPLNSFFEVVVWLPLVDVYRTKSMYILNKEKSRIALELLKKPDSGYAEYQRYAEQEGVPLNIPFGSACFFWTGLVHYIPMNLEDETRWVLNIRYKNLFSPVGAKGLTEFFDLLQLSPLTKLAFENERVSYGE